MLFSGDMTMQRMLSPSGLQAIRNLLIRLAPLLAAAPCACANAASPVLPYDNFVHWVSTGRLDLALEQFAQDAVVVAGPDCTEQMPCVGRAAIRQRYLAALEAGRAQLPLRDQRLEGQRLRTRDETIRQAVPHESVTRQRGGHSCEFRNGRIASLRVEYDTGDLRTAAFVAQKAKQAGNSQAAPADASMTLLHSFSIAAPGKWQTVSVDLSPRAWQVGGAGGPAATEPQLRSVLSGLRGLLIGGRCTTLTSGATHYPCGFAISSVNLAGRASDASAAGAWLASAGGKPIPALRRSGDRAGEGSITIYDDSAGPPTLAGGQRLLGALAPQSLLTDQAAAYGARLRFRFRALPNPVAGSPIDSASGTVMITSDGAYFAPAPPITEPPIPVRTPPHEAPGFEPGRSS
jgi:hypothetical protein